MKSDYLNGIRIFSPKDEKSLIDYSIYNKKILIAINAEKILNADKRLKEIINKNIGYPDGIGAVMGLKRKGFNEVFKIPGSKLWLKLLDHYYLSKTFYIIGSKQSIIEQAIIKLKDNYHGINILNYRNGYINNSIEKENLFKDIKLKKPDIVLVATGSPNQEFLMDDLYKIHQALYIGLGGSIDAYVGHLKLAPKWWYDNNLEWLYRLIQEPKRIVRQIYLIRFLVLLYLNKL